VGKTKEKLTPIPRNSSRKPRENPRAQNAANQCKGASLGTNSPGPPDLSHLLAMNVRAVPLADVAFLPDNPLEHSEESVEDMRDRLRTRGQIVALVLNKRHTPPVVVGGNKRLRAMLAENWTHGAFVEVDLPDEDAMALALELNALQDQSWSKDLLTKAMKRLDGITLGARMDGLMARLSEAQKLIPRLGGDGTSGAPDHGPQTDRAAELRAKWQTAPGQLWRIGQSHRLLIGDSLDPAARATVLDGAAPGIVILDPPFEMTEAKWTRLIADPCIVFGQARHLRAIPDRLWRFERVIDKGKAHRSATVQVGHRHSFIAQCGSVKTLPGNAETYPSIIAQEWDHDFDYCKPVALLVEHLTHWTPPWEVALDCFAGSGSSILAAERMGRTCYAVEIDPATAAICLQRMADAGLSVSS
jgi:hypothetical protein